MGFLKCSDTYLRFAGQCTQCGHCTEACDSLEKAGMTLGDIAREMLAAQRGAESPYDVQANLARNPKLAQAVRGCFFCTSCKNTCFAHNDVCDLIYHARVDYQELGLVERYSWSSVQVDQEWDVFTVFRAVYGIGYNDLIRHVACDEHEAESDCEVAFFPGCSLAAYGADLTREIFDAVQELGGKTTMIDHCCGSPLKSAGFFDRAEALCDRISEEVSFSGAKQLVCVCPGCANAMKATLARNGVDVEVISLAAYLTRQGFTPKRELPEGEIWLSKACQDRDGSYLDETRKVLGIDADSPAIFHGCCGAGGAVSAFQPDRQAAHADEKLSFAPDGATVVSMCPTCAYTYASRLMEHPRDIANKHYTELLFENQFDWNVTYALLGSMWVGEYAAWVEQVLD